MKSTYLARGFCVLLLCLLTFGFGTPTFAHTIPTRAGKITEYSIPDPTSSPYYITLGADGNLWFGEGGSNKLGRITPSGHFTEIMPPFGCGPACGPDSPVASPSGAIWFEEGDEIARMTRQGKFTEFAIPINGNLGTMTLGPDGNIWFAELDNATIGRITPKGKVTLFAIPTLNSDPYGITSGPDGNVWFTERYTNKIGRITLNGKITEFRVPTPGSYPDLITSGPDGNLWFSESRADKIGRITPSGKITEFPLPDFSYPVGIASGPDGNLWFTENYANKIGRITPGGHITLFPIPSPGSDVWGITAGPDSALWFALVSSNQIGKITTK